MTRNYNTIDVETENNGVKQCRRHIQYTYDLYYIISHLPPIILQRTHLDNNKLQHNRCRKRKQWSKEC